MGFKRLSEDTTGDFFEIISKKDKKGSVIITSNKIFEQLGDVFTDNILVSAIQDRGIHYSNIIKINGPMFPGEKSKRKEEIEFNFFVFQL